VRSCVGIVLRGVPDATTVPAAKIFDVSSLTERFKENCVRRIARRALLLEHRRTLLSNTSSGAVIPAKKLASSQFGCTLFLNYLRRLSNGRRIAGPMGRRLRFADLQACATCPRCRGHGWLCEQHPHCYWPHDDCMGPGIPCDAPGCLADWLARTMNREPRNRPKRLPVH
jgi:hypothetical protein